MVAATAFIVPVRSEWEAQPAWACEPSLRSWPGGVGPRACARVSSVPPPQAGASFRGWQGLDRAWATGLSPLRRVSRTRSPLPRDALWRGWRRPSPDREAILEPALPERLLPPRGEGGHREPAILAPVWDPESKPGRAAGVSPYTDSATPLPTPGARAPRWEARLRLCPAAPGAGEEEEAPVPGLRG